MKTHEKLPASVQLPRRYLSLYSNIIDGCNDSNIIYLDDYNTNASLPLYHIEEGQYICLVGNIFIGSDSDIIGLAAFPDNKYDFEYSDPIQNPLVSIAKEENLYLTSNFPITRINCKDTTKNCTIQVASLPPSCHVKDKNPLDEKIYEFSLKVVLDTKRQGNYTFKQYTQVNREIPRIFSTTGVFISKSNRTFKYSERGEPKIDSYPHNFLTASDKMMYRMHTIELRVENTSEEIYELNFKYGEIPDTETQEPFLFREDLSLTLPTKY
ncbi:hypothetical protein TVAG_304660 [Trichomonas vaginalis G3]|uniref:Uncharacterized protein n=1 Tax=Trichomonas vaginalis (strain ATCC PRA-98 / G3) TaxID=412133 RepID=A2F2Q1_TRIV3|nr:hypothetical protein TVAGG3_1020410 [Trichomonas vaginalis G3]EAY00825.1 hypothetical protein TVAG_304660 [Trichomonas vaginalis G3]KAI5492095.1 hypothetical protein TVAGG3_1020410 [Trichomonas vaginalis G3]|eukprot:XP_001313754.1 hypothetical protein [Trichomonas vaginalis G3]